VLAAGAGALRAILVPVAALFSRAVPQPRQIVHIILDFEKRPRLRALSYGARTDGEQLQGGGAAVRKYRRDAREGEKYRIKAAESHDNSG
jgi:hypothetical protein